MQLEFFVVSESAAIDEATDRLSVFNVLEVLNVDSGFPYVLPTACAISLLRVDEADLATDWQATLLVTLPGEESRTFTANLQLGDGAKRHRLIQRLVGIPISGPGVVRFEFRINGNHMADHMVEFLVSEDEPVTPAAE